MPGFSNTPESGQPHSYATPSGDGSLSSLFNAARQEPGFFEAAMRSAGNGDDAATTLNVRKIRASAVARIHAIARTRGWTLAQAIEAMTMFTVMLQHLDDDDELDFSRDLLSRLLERTGLKLIKA